MKFSMPQVAPHPDQGDELRRSKTRKRKRSRDRLIPNRSGPAAVRVAPRKKIAAAIRDKRKIVSRLSEVRMKLATL
jgi:hypothetical protein